MTTNGRQAMPVITENIPASLRALPRWVCWRYDAEGKKPPISPQTGRATAYTNPKNHLTFGDALAGYNKRCGRRGGLGFVLPDGIVAVDLDGCVDDDGNLAPWATGILERFQGTYCERSPSGYGMRILLRGQLPAGAKGQPGHIEVFGSGRYVTLTGQTRPGSPSDVANCQDALEWICREYLQGSEQHTPTHNNPASNGLNGLNGLTGSKKRALIEDVLKATLPNGPGQRNACILQLARGLKFDCQLADTPLPELRGIVQGWWRMARAHVRTKDFLTTWQDFQRAWRRADTPLTDDVLNAAIARAKADPLPSDFADWFDLPAARLLLALCRELAGSSNGVFFLSSYRAGKAIGASQRTTHNWLRTMVDDGIIEVVEAGTHREGGGRANRYRWCGTDNRKSGEVAS